MKVSVIIPVYNDYEILSSLLLPSIERQTLGLKNMEVIVVDDGTDPEKRLPLPKWVNFFAREHKGANYARNVGQENATGEYLIFPDADCEFFPEALKRMATELDRDHLVRFVYCPFIQVGDLGWLTLFPSYKFNKKLLEKQNYISVCTMFRKNAALGWNEKLNRFQDWELWIRMSRAGYCGKLIPEPLFFHFIRKKAISQSYKTYADARKEMFMALDGKVPDDHPCTTGNVHADFSHTCEYGSIKGKKVTPEELAKIKAEAEKNRKE